MDFTNTKWTDIANRALSMISADMLSTIDEGTTESNYVKVLLPQVVEEVYASLPLDDVSRYTELPILSGKVHLGSPYSHAFKLPESCAFVREVILDGSESEWQKINGAILSSSSSCSIRYVALPDVPTDMPYYARSLVSVLLASRLAGPVAHNESLANLYKSQYEVQLQRAFTFTQPYKNQDYYYSSESYSEDR